MYYALKAKKKKKNKIKKLGRAGSKDSPTLLGNDLKTARPTFQQDTETGDCYFSFLIVMSCNCATLAKRDNLGLTDRIELEKCSIIQTKKKTKPKKPKPNQKKKQHQTRSQQKTSKKKPIYTHSPQKANNSKKPTTHHHQKPAKLQKDSKWRFLRFAFFRKSFRFFYSKPFNLFCCLLNQSCPYNTQEPFQYLKWCLSPL